MDVVIQGHTTLDAYSYFLVNFHPCVNGVNGRTNCYPQSITSQYLASTGVSVKMQDIELTPQKYNSPIQVRTRELTAPVMDSLYNNIQAYFHIISMETDNDIIGFEGITNNKIEKYFKYDVTFMINSINDKDKLPSITGEPICNIQLQLTEQMITINRTYTKLIEVLGDVGGLMEFVFSFFKILSIFMTEALYEKSLVNSLFSFDMDRKMIEIKVRKKEKTKLFENEPEIFNQSKSNNKLSSQTSIYAYDNVLKANNMIDESNPNNLNNEPSNNNEQVIQKRHRKGKKKN